MAVLQPQLLRSPTGKLRHRFLQCGQVQYRMAKAARAGDLLFCRWLQKFDTLLVKSRFPRPGLLMNSRTYLCF